MPSLVMTGTAIDGAVPLGLTVEEGVLDGEEVDEAVDDAVELGL